jgi:hypothetical protein
MGIAFGYQIKEGKVQRGKEKEIGLTFKGFFLEREHSIIAKV